MEVTGTVVTTESHFVVEVAEPDSRRSSESMLTGALNAVTFGYLVVHYPERDVNLFMDGATAERVLAVFSGQSPKGVLEDTLVRGASSMRNMWVTFDIERPLAVSWLPGVPSDTSRRMTVEPPAEDASE